MCALQSSLSDVILTVTPNPAIDVTYTLPALLPGIVHRVQELTSRAGGKGVNVARVLQQLGASPLVTGLSGGPRGLELERELAAAGIATALVDALPDVRTTLVVHDDSGVTTSLWEPGRPPADPDAAAAALLDRCAALLPGARAMVVSGSLPAGVDPALPARLAAIAAAAGVPVIIDGDDAALLAAADAGHAVLMPNREELARLVDHPVTTIGDVAAAAERLCAGGTPAVVATLGADGMLAATATGTWWARPVTPVAGNPTGAGDAAAAAVAIGLTAGVPDWPRILADAIALSAAAVARPVAGEVDVELYRTWRSQVRVLASPAAP